MGEECLCNQPGWCINTDKYQCDNSQVRAGFCMGAANIRCCPSSMFSPVKPALAGGGSAVAGASATTTAHVRPDAPQFEGCNKGQEGFCINTQDYSCHGADVMTGFCTGASHIRCCPSLQVWAVLQGARNGGDAGDGAVVNKVSFAEGGADAGYGTCNKGLTGTCIDASSDSGSCDISTVSGFCDGAANIKCCPASETKSDGTTVPTELVLQLSCEGGTRPEPRSGSSSGTGGSSSVGFSSGGDGGTSALTISSDVQQQINMRSTNASAAVGAATDSFIASCGLGSRTQLQDGWVACICDKSAECTGAGYSYWAREVCRDCYCDSAELSDFRNELAAFESASASAGAGRGRAPAAEEPGRSSSSSDGDSAAVVVGVLCAVLVVLALIAVAAGMQMRSQSGSATLASTEGKVAINAVLAGDRVGHANPVYAVPMAGADNGEAAQYVVVGDSGQSRVRTISNATYLNSSHV